MTQVIREYLSNHPQAADTLDGIMTWWMAREYYLRYRTIIEQALESLVDGGVLQKQEVADGEIVYSMIR